MSLFKKDQHSIFFSESFLLILVIVTLLVGGIYVTDQQMLRLGANDPQIQLSEDLSHNLSSGQIDPSAAFQNDLSIDLNQSISPFSAVFDDQGNLISSNAHLGQSPLSLPSGIFDYVRQNGEDRITWQPRPGLRFATVINHFSSNDQSGFVMSGRSLREVEDRINQLTLQAGFGWLITLIAAYLLLFFFSKKKNL